MNDVAERFEALRPRLLRLAYSQLGSLAEAEDVVQEAWLRLSRTDAAAIEDLGAWLVTVVSRLALDALGSARMRREQYVGQWLPDLLVGAAGGDADPADRVTLDETVSHALLFVLERLSPAERTAFILHDVFGYSFDEVGDVVGRTPAAAIEDLGAWLVTVVSRLALDALGSARMRREQYVGQWLPDLLVGAAGGDADPADRVTLDETVSHALLFVLERLSPAERTAFILHDVFGYSFDEVGDVVGRTPAAARQLASRARRHVVEQRPRQSGTPLEQQHAVEAFAVAADGGDIEALLAVLDPDVVMRSDGGGRVHAARKPLVGADRVGRALMALLRKFAGRLDVRFADVNGLPGLLMVNREDGQVSVVAFTVDAGRITTIHIQRNPDKLGRVSAPGAPAP